MRQQQHTVGAFLQTEQRRRAEASRKAVEAAAEAKQEADIAAYHAQLRDKEAQKQHQHSLGREDQPAGRPLLPPPPHSLPCIVNIPHAAYAAAIISHSTLLLPQNAQAIPSNPKSHCVSQLSICNVSILA